MSRHFTVQCRLHRPTMRHTVTVEADTLEEALEKALESRQRTTLTAGTRTDHCQ